MATKTTKPGKVTVTTTVQFSFDTETPGAWRLKEDAAKDDHLIGTLYIRKSKMSTKPANGVELTVTVK